MQNKKIKKWIRFFFIKKVRTISMLKFEILGDWNMHL